VHVDRGVLVCASGHSYAMVEGTPVMLLPDVKQTHPAAVRALAQSARRAEIQTGISATRRSAEIDPFVQEEIGATNGNMYRGLIGKLRDYPIPDLPMHVSPGERFLDVGCNWGRWCIAAGRLDCLAIGIDPSLDAVLAARRVARQLGVHANYLVADARYLPFADQTIDRVFSYSVLQHFSKEDARLSLGEMERVLRGDGRVVVQMANAWGLRCLYHQARRRFREPERFEVRYWTIRELKATFEALIGQTRLAVDGYLSLNSRPGDLGLLPVRYRAVVRCSEALRAVSERLPWLAYVADSVYVESVRMPRAQSPGLGREARLHAR
jgi:SAM-dependent methyltransferase